MTTGAVTPTAVLLRPSNPSATPAVCEFINKRKFVPVKIVKGVSITEWEFYKDALDADCYINVPVAKRHGLSRLSLGMKNVMGVIGGKRGEIHQSIGQRFADLNTVIRPKLTVIDATRILLRHGPQGGDLDDVKILDTLTGVNRPRRSRPLCDDAVQSKARCYRLDERRAPSPALARWIWAKYTY